MCNVPLAYVSEHRVYCILRVAHDALVHAQAEWMYANLGKITFHECADVHGRVKCRHFSLLVPGHVMAERFFFSFFSSNINIIGALGLFMRMGLG